jgi:hypothetical protein
VITPATPASCRGVSEQMPQRLLEVGTAKPMIGLL